ncbi:hypothetical protein TNCV_4450171 [Trichonephila clavipes]|nr:hypothetical protein TNCV_4450171 [Trichonephila clavipes]
MDRSDAAIKRCWQEWVDSGIFQGHDGSGRPRAPSDREDKLIVRSAVTTPDSSLSTIRLFNDKSRFQLCPDDHRRRVWRRPGSVPTLLSLLHATQALNQELWFGMPFLSTAGLLCTSLEATGSTAVRR